VAVVMVMPMMVMPMMVVVMPAGMGMDMVACHAASLARRRENVAGHLAGDLNYCFCVMCAAA
jgi:hypothetical protein